MSVWRGQIALLSILFATAAHSAGLHPVFSSPQFFDLLAKSPDVWETAARVAQNEHPDFLNLPSECASAAGASASHDYMNLIQRLRTAELAGFAREWGARLDKALHNPSLLPLLEIESLCGSNQVIFRKGTARHFSVSEELLWNGQADSFGGPELLETFEPAIDKSGQKPRRLYPPAQSIGERITLLKGRLRREQTNYTSAVRKGLYRPREEYDLARAIGVINRYLTAAHLLYAIAPDDEVKAEVLTHMQFVADTWQPSIIAQVKTLVEDESARASIAESLRTIHEAVDGINQLVLRSRDRPRL